MRPHSSLFSHYPLVHLAVAFSAGICIAGSLRFSIAAGLVCTAVTLILFIKQRLRLAALALLSAIFFTGAILANRERRHVDSHALKTEGEPVTLTGWLDGPPAFARAQVYLSF